MVDVDCHLIGRLLSIKKQGVNTRVDDIVGGGQWAWQILLAMSSDTIQLKKPGFNMRWMMQ